MLTVVVVDAEYMRHILMIYVANIAIVDISFVDSSVVNWLHTGDAKIMHLQNKLLNQHEDKFTKDLFSCILLKFCIFFDALQFYT